MLQQVGLEELRTFFATDFPQSTVTIEDVGGGRARVRQEVGHAQLRPGGTVSGPVMMAVADAGSYAAVLSAIGIVPLAVTTNLTINFMRRPSAHAAILADATTLLKVGQRLVVAEIRLYSEGDDALVAHATATYAIPPREP
ncbi:MAG: PaaI family thioesterase [Pyrinomonadaceae bacterium]